MLKHRTLPVVIFAFCIFVETSGLGIHIFGKKDGSVKDDLSADEGSVKEEASTRPPLLTIPRPEDHPLHHSNDPNHPFNNFPTLGGSRSTIVATKTVYVEVTSTITQHPICIEAHGVKPPCLPHHTHNQGYEEGYGSHHEHGSHHNFGFEAGINGFFREGGQEIDRIQPTASIEMLEPTRILGGVSETAPAPSEFEEDEIAEDEVTRSARYLKIHSATPFAPFKSESEIDEAPEDTAESDGRTIENLINRQPEYHYATKTLWVTKVQKYIDHRVTATLLIKNCIPSEFHFPYCHVERDPHVPYYPGSYQYKPVHQQVGHKPIHHEVVHKPVHHEPIHHEVVHKPVHHEPIHHEVAHKPVHHEPIHHEVVHKPVHHEPIHHEVVHKPVHHEPVHHQTSIPVHEHHYQDTSYHNAHEYQQPIHVETQYIPGHEIGFQGQASASLAGGVSTNFKENTNESEQLPTSS